MQKFLMPIRQPMFWEHFGQQSHLMCVCVCVLYVIPPRQASLNTNNISQCFIFAADLLFIFWRTNGNNNNNNKNEEIEKCLVAIYGTA